jgi:predicted RNase H-like HicB family nuclease
MFWAQVGEWGGCLPQGDSLDELVEALCEAIGLYVTSDDEEPGPIWLRVDGDRASR